MSHKHFYKKRKKGLPPGSFVYTGKQQDVAVCTAITYNASNIQTASLTALPQLLNQDSFVWIDQRGLSEIEQITKIGELLQIHPLALEDVLNTHQRAKLEEYTEGIFFVLHHIHWDDTSSTINTEQIALHWNKKHLTSFQELADDTFKLIRERLQDSSRKIRKSGPDYLAYTIIDYIVDSYFEVLDKLEEKILRLQNEIHPHSQLSQVRTEIAELRGSTTKLRRLIAPLREATGRLQRIESSFLDPSNHVYFRDVSDHVQQILDYLESLLEELNNNQELYQSEMSQRMNHVMKLLTMISTIFIPLSFIAGVYGMNFDHMPELRNPNGYYVTIGVMSVLTFGMLAYFKWEKWL